MTDNLFYGWYDDPAQPSDKPSFDPPHDGPCLLCGRPIVADDVRTYSIMMTEGYGRRSYFYRTHRTCGEAADDRVLNAADAVIWDMIARNGD